MSNYPDGLDEQMRELAARLNIETRAKGIEKDDLEPEHAHWIAEALADAAQQYALVLARMTSSECEHLPGACPTQLQTRYMLAGIVIPSVIVSAIRRDEELTYEEIMEHALALAERLHSHARASIGRPL